MTEHRPGREVGLLVGYWLGRGEVLTVSQVAKQAGCSYTSAWRALRDASRVLPTEQNPRNGQWWLIRVRMRREA